MLELGPDLPHAPLRFAGIQIGGKPVQFGEEFEAEDGWLKGMEVTLKNVSRREVVFIELDVNFPETLSTGVEMSYPVTLGGKLRSEVDEAAPVLARPGGELKLGLDEGRYQGLVRFVARRHRMGEVSRAVLRVGFMIFADGLGYGAGYYYRRDEENPRRWSPLADERGDPIIPD